MNKVKALLFDFDYTLADSSTAIVKCANYALVGLGFEMASPHTIRQLIGLSLTDTFAALVGEQHLSRETEFRILWRELSEKIMADETCMLPGVVETLLLIRNRGLKLGIVSTKFRSRIEKVLLREGIANLFDTIVGGDDVEHHKPHPDGIYKALNQLNSISHETVYVGDSEVDAMAAMRAKLQFIAVLSGVTEASRFTAYEPRAIIQCFKELNQTINP